MVAFLECIEVRASPEKGRYIIAAEDIPPNTVVLRDRPFASVSKFAQFCSECFDRLATLSRENHPFLCTNCEDDHNKSAFAPGTKSLLVLCYIVATKVFNDPDFSVSTYLELTKVENVRKHRALDGSDFAAIAQLVTRDLDVDTGDIKQVCDSLEHSNNRVSRREMEIVVRHIFSTFPCNVQGITCLEERGIGTFTEKRIASAMYPTLALMNHSCSPNTRIHFEKSVVVVTTTSHIKAGEEVFHNYGPNTLHHSWEKRQESLQFQYGFTCDCTACSVGRNGELALSLKCKECGSSVTVGYGHIVRCQSCCHRSSVQHYNDIANDICAKLSFMCAGPRLTDVRLIDAVVSEIHSIYSSHNPMLGNVLDSCASLYEMNGEWGKAIKCSSLSCDIVKSKVGPWSLTHALEMLKLCLLKIRSGVGRSDNELVSDVKAVLDTVKFSKIHDAQSIAILSRFLHDCS